MFRRSLSKLITDNLVRQSSAGTLTLKAACSIAASGDVSLHRPGVDPAKTERLKTFGQYVAECLPKYVQRIMIQHGDELELCIHPEGVVPGNKHLPGLKCIVTVESPARKKVQRALLSFERH